MVAILRQVCDLGYLVVVRAGTDGLELVAMEAGGTNWSHAVRVDERGEDGLYKAACALAVAMVRWGTGGPVDLSLIKALLKTIERQEKRIEELERRSGG